jgi:hypothetical protein
LTEPTPFPDWANQNQSAAYQQLSNLVNAGDDVRATYSYVNSGYSVWNTAETTMKEQIGKQPPGIPPADWEAVRSQLETEFSYVAAARAWFDNNKALADYVFDEAADQIASVTAGVTITDGSNSTASVVLEWVELVLGFIAQIAGAVGQEEVSIVTGLLQTTFNAALDALPSGGNSVSTQVFMVENYLDDTQNNFTEANACVMAQYVGDWGLLQLIGVGSVQGTYKWGLGTTAPELAHAQVVGANAQELWLYKQFSPVTWTVWRGGCYVSDPGCAANDSYDGNYVWYWPNDGISVNFTGYIVVNGQDYPHFPALDRIEKLGGNWCDIISNR